MSLAASTVVFTNDADAGEPGRPLVAADGLDGAAKRSVPHQQVRDSEDHDQKDGQERALMNIGLQEAYRFSYNATTMPKYVGTA